MTILYSMIREADRTKKNNLAAQKAAALKEKAEAAKKPPKGRAKPDSKELAEANAFASPLNDKGGLDLNHANRDEPEGARFLDMTHAILSGYAVWPNPWSVDLATIYVALTHFVNDDGQPLFNAIPHYLIVGAHGSGKTRAGKVMRAMMRNPTGIAVRYTMPGIRNALNAGQTPFLDELQRYFVTGRGYQDLQAIIAGSYSADTTTLDGQNGTGPNDRDAYGPMVLMGQPKLITNTGDNLDDLLERSIVVNWKKSFRTDIPELDDRFRFFTESIRNLLSLWGAAERPDGPKPKIWPVHSMPAALVARAAEISNPILAIADRAVQPSVVAEKGHDIRWATRAREAVLQAFKGHGNDPSNVVDDLQSQMEAMGFKVGE